MNVLTRRIWRTSALPACLLVGALLLSLVACSSDGGGGTTIAGDAVPVTTAPPSGPTGSATAPGASGTPGSPASPGTPPRTKTLTKAEYLHPDGLYFGLATFHGPNRATTASASAAAGRPPRILEYYQDWRRDFSASDAELAYQQGALPLVTWEPYGDSRSADQPKYALKRIASGTYDAYIIRFARQVKAIGQPIGLRFAHEMNGDWYPWSEKNSGNSYGDYVKAWRHIHDLFQIVGASEVIWVWSPNVLRGTNGVALNPLYPGDGYVDWIGLDGYGFGERTATEVLQPTVDEITKFSHKPILVSETGSAPGPQQAGWTADLFRWIKRTPNVIGFIWFQYSKDEGGKYDYRFDISPQTKTAFRKGLDSLTLRPWPMSAGGS
ncbi:MULTISPECIES: glycoside hydrolase family 26 protein [unclassified Streptomyces]|uniref:glycoside hydrolase family 26 protein n=1 Tax=unclassified Streptomyces TaxID=2593676 RepID=UPI00380646C9